VARELTKTLVHLRPTGAARHHEGLVHICPTPPPSLALFYPGSISMTFSSSFDADPDPTTQVAWPGSRGKRSTRSANASSTTLPETDDPNNTQATDRSRSSQGRGHAEKAGKKRMTALDLFNLSVSMGGAQIAWTVELG
jgi:hypothetical protein